MEKRASNKFSSSAFTFSITVVVVGLASLLCFTSGYYKQMPRLDELLALAEKKGKEENIDEATSNLKDFLANPINKDRNKRTYVACYFESDPSRLLFYRLFTAKNTLDPVYLEERSKAVSFLEGKNFVTFRGARGFYEELFPSVLFKQVASPFQHFQPIDIETINDRINHICDKNKLSKERQPLHIELLVTTYSSTVKKRIVVDAYTTDLGQ